MHDTIGGGLRGAVRHCTLATKVCQLLATCEIAGWPHYQPRAPLPHVLRPGSNHAVHTELVGVVMVRSNQRRHHCVTASLNDLTAAGPTGHARLLILIASLGTVLPDFTIYNCGSHAY